MKVQQKYIGSADADIEDRNMDAADKDYVQFANWQVQGVAPPGNVGCGTVNLDEAALAVGLLLTILFCRIRLSRTTAPARAKELSEQTNNCTWQAAQRRLAESALKESENRYRNSVEHGLGLMCVHDLDGVIQFVNRAAADLFFGYEPEQNDRSQSDVRNTSASHGANE